MSQANVSLNLLEKNTVRSDIDCPGDTLSYNCSVQSNSENVHLTWTITLPNKMTMVITYDSTSRLNESNYLDESISTILTDIRSDEYIESVLTVTLLSNVSLNGSRIECNIANLSSDSILLRVVTSGKNYFRGFLSDVIHLMSPPNFSSVGHGSRTTTSCFRCGYNIIIGAVTVT